MRKLLMSLVAALFITVGVATPILATFLPVSGPVAVYAQDNDGQGEDANGGQGEDTNADDEGDENGED